MGNKIIKCTIILSLSSILAKFLGIFFRWPLVMLIGDEGIGYYQMTYPLYMFFIGIVSGMPIAVSKLVSERMAYDDKESVLYIVNSAFKIMIILGVGTSLILFLMSKGIINFLKWDPKVYWSLIGVSIAPVSICVLGVLRGLFQGMENMFPTGISQIIEQIGRVLFGVYFAFLFFPKGIEYAAGGASIGASVGGVLSSLFMIVVYLRFKKKNFKNLNANKQKGKYLNKILKISIPLSLGATVSTVMVLIDSILVPQMLLNAGYSHTQSTILYGQLTGKVSVLTNIPLALSVALSTSIIPVLSKLFILKKNKELEEKIYSSLKLSSYIAFPCFMGLYFLAGPIMNVIFPNNSDGIDILRYASVSIPFVIFSQISTSILQSTNNYVKPVVNILIGCILKISITLFLTGTPRFNIYGAVLATIFSYILTSYLNLKAIKGNLRININIVEIVLSPLMCSLVMIISVLLSFEYIYRYFGSIIPSLFMCTIIGGFIYGISVFLFRRKDIEDMFLSIK